MGTLGRSVAAAAAVCLLLGLGGAGCSNTGSGPDLNRLTRPRWASTPAPAPSSPANAQRLLEWCYNTKSLVPCRELFTEDYRWYCSPLDSAGAGWRGMPWTRDDELISATHLFIGGSAEQPPANIIRLTFERNFLVYPDRYYTHFPDGTPRDPTGIWHKEIRTTVALQIGADDGNTLEIRGHATFYFVRGDSALIPEELRQRGVGSDPGRWYIRRWDDDTAEEEGLAPTRPPAQRAPSRATRHAALAPQPSTKPTWCWLKIQYR